MRNESRLAAAFRVFSWGVVAIYAAGAPATAGAHHSFGLYSRELSELTGNLVDVQWANPHVYLTLRSRDVDGQELLWTLEAGAPYSLQRRGISADLFSIGEPLRIAGRAHLRETRRMWVDNILLGDGREVLVDGGSAPRWSARPIGLASARRPVDAAAADQGFFRVWSEESITHGQRLPFRVTPPREERPDLIARLDGYAARCEPMGMPGIMGTPHPIELVDGGAAIELRGMSNNARFVRVIHMAGATAESRASPLGYSRGRWDGPRRLVVETTHIDWPYFSDDRGIPQSSAVETREVFTLSEDQARLRYELTVTDPATFVAPAVALAIDYLALGETLAEPTNCGAEN